MIRDMTSGKPLRLILSFAIPLLLGNLFQQIYNMADTAIVGRFMGKEALAAVGATGSISNLVIGFTAGIAAGFGIVLAAYFGASDHERMRHCVANMIYLATAVSVLLTVTAVCLARPILIWMKTPSDIIADSYHYIVVVFAGISATMFYNVLANILRALGDSRSPLYFLILSCILNVLLDILFVVAIPLGTAGAGLATVLAQICSAMACLFYIKKRLPMLRFTRGDLRPNLGLMKRLMLQGLPMALQLSITATGAIILQSAVNSLGSDTVAAVTAATKVQLFAFMLLESLGVTMATYCSQNLGAGKYCRIRQGVHTGLAVSLVCSVISGVLIYTLGHYAALLFLNSAEISVLSSVKQFLRVGTAFYPVLSFMYIYRNSVQGLGYSLPAMLGGVLEMVTRSFVALFFVYRIGFDAACVAQPVSWIPVVLLMVPTYYIQLRKQEKKHS
ncbi:MAG: MATE family efflux transporter [Clostridia bacterium]|nr:MATE family efflux transporter [Clostridia bacterium]